MNPETKSTERGQALIIMALALVGLLGFAALAIDGGMVYADRRHAQNGSDASSLAGGSAAALSLENSHMTYGQWNCNDSRVLAAEQAAKTTAIGRAGDNDFTINLDLSDHNGVTTDCGIENHGFWIDKYIDITTLISSTTQTSLVHFVFPGPLINNVEAVTRVRPRQPMAYGNAIVGLNEAPCQGNQNGVQFSGSNQTTVDGGGVFSNGCLDGGGASFNVDITNGGVFYAGEGTGHLENFNPSPTQAPAPLPPASYSTDPPDCSGLTDYGVHNGGGDISPGRYSRIQLPNGELNMAPGLYCITGSPNALIVTGGILEGHGVTIYVENGDVDISGNAEVNLSAPTRSPDPSPAIPGMVIYLAPGNTNEVRLEGNDESSFLGTIYAPDGDIVIIGTSGTYPTFSTQLIGMNVEVSGNATIDINFMSDENYNLPSSIELYK